MVRSMKVLGVVVLLCSVAFVAAENTSDDGKKENSVTKIVKDDPAQEEAAFEAKENADVEAYEKAYEEAYEEDDEEAYEEDDEEDYVELQDPQQRMTLTRQAWRINTRISRRT